MALLPAEGDLEDLMEQRQGHRIGHQQAPPDGGLDVHQLNAQLVVPEPRLALALRPAYEVFDRALCVVGVSGA